MQVSRAIAIWLECHKSHSRENTLKACQAALDTFPSEFGDRKISKISPEEILLFLNRVTEGKKPQTRRARCAHLSAFFTFIRNNFDSDFRNACDAPLMKRIFLIAGSKVTGISHSKRPPSVYSQSGVELSLTIASNMGNLCPINLPIHLS